jgi:hypothetical protein
MTSAATVFSTSLLVTLQLLLLPTQSRAGIFSGLTGGGAKQQCKDAASCQAHMQNLIENLDGQRKKYVR